MFQNLSRHLELITAESLNTQSWLSISNALLLTTERWQVANFVPHWSFCSFLTPISLCDSDDDTEAAQCCWQKQRGLLKSQHKKRKLSLGGVRPAKGKPSCLYDSQISCLPQIFPDHRDNDLKAKQTNWTGCSISLKCRFLCLIWNVLSHCLLFHFGGVWRIMITSELAF